MRRQWTRRPRLIGTNLVRVEQLDGAGNVELGRNEKLHGRVPFDTRIIGGGVRRPAHPLEELLDGLNSTSEALMRKPEGT